MAVTKIVDFNYNPDMNFFKKIVANEKSVL